MVEDALKATRTLHRLIMTVALVTIVFSLSISLPDGKSRQKELIDKLIAVDFGQYDTFVQQRVSKASDSTLRPIGEALEKDLNDAGHLVFGLDKIGAALSTTPHVGKVLVDQLVLSDVSNATLTAMDALNGLSLSRDVQILVPRTKGLVSEIDQFLSANPGAGKRVDSVRIAIDEFSFSAESFLPGGEASVGVYFELLDAVRMGGAPVFSATIEADVQEVPGTSFLRWLEAQDLDDGLAVIANDKVKFAAELDAATVGFRNEKLGVLSLRLADEIAKSSPQKQSVSILGTTVPGTLVIFASPIVLFSLAYYFFHHTSHLRRLCATNEDAFEQFAWLPLSLRRWFDVPFVGRATRLSAGVLEVTMSSVVLPLVALGVLVTQVVQFGAISWKLALWMVVASAGVAVFGLLAARNVDDIKRYLDTHEGGK